MRYVVSYDLENASTEEYQTLEDELERLGGKRVLQSQWVVRMSGLLPKEVCGYFLRFVSDKNRTCLLVTELDGGGWATWRTLNDLDTV